MMQIASLFKESDPGSGKPIKLQLIMSSLVLTVMITFFSHNDCNKIYTDIPFLKQTIPIESAFNRLTIYYDRNVLLIEGDRNEIQGSILL